MRAFTVVCLEDDCDVARLIELSLHACWPVDIQIAHDGQRGLQLIRKTRPNLILLDLGLPGLNGWEVLAALRNDPALASVPVIVLTAIPIEHQYHYREWFDQIATYIVKPFSPRSLRDDVRPFMPPAVAPQA